VTPLRLVIIGILVYVLYRLLTGSRGKGTHGRKNGNVDPGKAVQDVLVEDPVCHTYIPKGQAIHLHHDKQMYYFCSDKCCRMFLKEKGAEK
jgi:YHS domain-containing protein